MEQPSIKLFLSYSHKDKDWKDQFFPYLESLAETCGFEIWVDTMIVAGGSWNDAIMQKLEASHIILLLLSPDFTRSKFCMTKEMTVALAKHKNGQAIVVPVLARPLPDADYPFDYIQALPDPDTSGGRAVSVYQPAPDAAWKNVEAKMRLAIQPIIRDFQHCNIDARRRVIIDNLSQRKVTEAFGLLFDFCDQFAQGDEDINTEALSYQITYQPLFADAAAGSNYDTKKFTEMVQEVIKLMNKVRKMPLRASA